MSEIRTRDFSRSPREIGFSADGETYTCLSAVPPVVLQDIMKLIEGIDADVTKIDDIFELVMIESEAARIKARLAAGHANPIDIHQAAEIATFLVEQYAQRPTMPSEVSTSGSRAEKNGSSSTDGASSEVSIL